MYRLGARLRPRPRLIHTTAPSSTPSSTVQHYSTQLQRRYPSADPPSLVISFLILHELTAIVPLVCSFFALKALGVGAGLVGWAVAESEGSEGEASWSRGKLGDWIAEGEQKAERVGRRYGMFGYQKETSEERATRREADGHAGVAVRGTSTEVKVSGDVANLVASYLLVKALLPARILLSLRLAPPLANVVARRFKRLRGWGERLLKRRKAAD